MAVNTPPDNNVVDSADESNDQQVSVKWPTDDDMEYLEKHVEFIDTIALKNNTNVSLKTKPCRIKFKNLDNLPENTLLHENVGRLFDIFIRHVLKKTGGNLETTKFWLNLQHPGYKEQDGFWIMHKTYKMANGHTLLNTISKHVQSNAEISLDETMMLTMRVFSNELPKQMVGKGNRIPDQILRKFGLKNPMVVGDTHCLAKAFVIGMHWSDMNSAVNDVAEKEHGNIYKKLIRKDRQSRPRYQLELAQKLLVDANLDPNQEEHNMEDLIRLAEKNPEYRVCVWTLEFGVAFPTIAFERNEHAPGLIPMFYVDNHYEFFVPTCTNIKVRYCFKCSKLVDHNHFKKCEARCRRCGRFECVSDPKENKFCELCNIWFHGKACYDAHFIAQKSGSLPFCDKYEKCTNCAKIDRRDTYSHVPHRCFHRDYCRICRQKISGPHECTHAPPTEAYTQRMKKKQEDWVIVVYDCESIVSKTAEYTGANYLGEKHVVNALCYRLLCNKCMGEACATCGEAQYLAYNLEEATVLERFANFLKTDVRLKNARIIAHNGGRYDHVFVLEELMKNEHFGTDFIMSGNTIISVTLKISRNNELHFLDSCKFLPMPLAQLPAAFQLETKDKGHFPYMFNHPGNYGVVLPTLPPIEYYEPQYMSVKKRKAFENWYEENKNTEFNFDEEIKSYCLNDVQILSEALVKFIKMCQQDFGGWNPILQATTLASFVLFSMRMDHMKDSVVGYIPETGYVSRNNSKIALKMLLWLESQDPSLKLRHTLCSEGEYVASCENGCFAVDGYNEATNEIFEIHGCMYHGCPKCYLDREKISPHDKSRCVRELYDSTMFKDEALRNSGYKLNVYWECEINEQLVKNSKMATFFKNCNHAHQLRPRHAMFGGRTQQFQSLVMADEDYTIEYYDFCSLYPYINIKGTEYPIGPPERITTYFAPIEPNQPTLYKGLIFCDVLPPKNCPLPVLPFRAKGKLLFPLCRTCAVSKTNTSCTHTKTSQRYLTGTWCYDELNVAIAEGYQLLKYHEVWHWAPDKWFRGGFFESFMAPLLKAKHEASGWPKENMSDVERRQHVQTIYDNDNVLIEEANVEKNPAMRSMTKLFLNSTWGKFAQNPIKTETRFFKTDEGTSVVNFFSEPGYEPKCFKEWGDDYVLVSRQPSKDAVQTSRNTNIVYGTLTTSAARVMLFKAMKLVGSDNLIYCDTDSIIFRQKRGTDPLGSLRGEALGQLTNEVEPGWKIVEIVVMAPKVYAYKMKNDANEEKAVVKAKGITLNSETSEMVNFESMKEIMQKTLSGKEKEFKVSRMRMKRGTNPLDGLQTVIETKRLRPTMDKGLFNENGVLIPFGTLDSEIEFDYPYVV